MTNDASDDQFRIEPTPVGRRTGHRLTASGAVAIVVLGVVLIAAFMGRGGDATRSVEPSDGALLGTLPSIPRAASTPPPGTAAPSRVPTAVQSRGPSPSSPPQPSHDPLPVLGDVALPGSPEIVLFQRVGDDITVLGWRPGEPGLVTRQTVNGAARDLNDTQAVQTELSPNGSLLLVHAFPATNGGPDTFRVFRLNGTGGREIWRSTSLGTDLWARFAPSGQLIVTSSGPLLRDRGWTIVDLSADPAVVLDIDLPPIPAPAPSASVDLGSQPYYYVPLSLSADGRWLYAMSVHATRPMYRPAYRISVATGRAEPIETFPTTGAARVVSPLVDGVTGRILLPGQDSSSQGFVEAWSAGAKSPDFHVDLGLVFEATWTDDGSVITADYDRLPGPFRFRVLSISATGKLGTTFLTAEGDNAALLGVRTGFAAAYVARMATGDRELVVIRLKDGAISGVHVNDPDGLVQTAGLRP